MDHRSIVVFLHLKGLSVKAKDVHIEIVHVLGSDAIAYLTVTKVFWNDVILEHEQKPRIERKIKDSRL
jgi:hypothetical protein